jgi:Fe-Mn family superoxide dismutase
MRGTLTLSTFLLPLLSIFTVRASEQQPFVFDEMSAPQYTLPPLPYAYDVSIPDWLGYSA